MPEADSPTAPRSPRLAALSLSLFTVIHLLALGLPFVLGVSVKSLALAFGLYWLRMFGITAGYHRYFAHRSYKAPRWFQFVLAWLGASSLQKGPLWWAGLHRVHHRWSDTPRDLHSPKQRGFLYSHLGWITSSEHDGTDYALIPDFAKFPELRWIDRYHWVPAIPFGLLCFAVDGWRGLVWGMGVSTMLCWHCTFFINSLAHVWGSRRYETTDTSRNNLWLALLTMGEGWHNNHHHYMNSANQGFFWWEVDASYYLLRALSFFRVVRDLRRPPAHVLRERLIGAADTVAQRISDARQLAGQRIAEATHVAETRLAEAREAVTEVAQSAEATVAEVKHAAETKLAEAREAVSEVVDAVETAGTEAKTAG